MANPEHVEIVKQGAKAIAAWREKNPGIRLDLSWADLSKADLRRVDLSAANLQGANLCGADLRVAQLTLSNLQCVHLCQADLSGADLRRVDLSESNLIGADLSHADLGGADLTRADLGAADLSGADLSDVCLDGAIMGSTTLADLNFSIVKGLSTVEHQGPSSIGVDTLYKSQGKIPDEFLRGCGVPEDFIKYLPYLIGEMQPIQYQTCFISYSSKDEEFARRLHARMRAEKMRVWFAPEDMQGGKKIIEQIDRAIQVNDRLLLVLSEQSMKSEWVKTEIRRARKVELRDDRRKLFPIRLVSMARLDKWQCLATDPDEDVAAEVRSYHIPDFSNWKNHDAFESAFADLLRDLREQA